MKKTYTVILVLMLMGSLVACSKQHEHTWTEWEVIKAPTIDEDGITQRTCSGCGEIEQLSISKLETETVTITLDNFYDYFEYVVYAYMPKRYTELYHDVPDGDNPNWGIAPNFDILNGWVLKNKYMNQLYEIEGKASFEIQGGEFYGIEMDEDNFGNYKMVEIDDLDAYGISPSKYYKEWTIDIEPKLDNINEDNHYGIFFWSGFYYKYDCGFFVCENQDDFHIISVEGELTLYKSITN